MRPQAWGLPAVLAGALVGIATADAGWWAPALLATALGSAVTVGVAAVARTEARAASVIAIALVVGMVGGGVRGSMAAPAGGAAGVESLPTDTPLRLTAVVADEPTPRAAEHDLVLEDLVLSNGGPVDGPVDGPRPGRLLVRVPRAFAVQAGDEVALEVTLRAPDAADAEEARYRERLRRQGIGGLGSSWELRVIGHRSHPLFEAPAVLRRWLLDGLVRTVPEPEASLGAGILLGVRAGIDPAIRDAFAVAGLSHVIAISGWNVAIVVALIATATQRLRARFGPRLPAVVAMLAVAGYVALVGASPAVVRAALMAAALLVARLGGSPAHAASALMGAVVVMVLVSPGALWDIGFQLSALATAGLIVLAAPIESRLGRWPAWIRTPVALTVAAQAATLPVLLATFEQVSLVAPLANVVVVPLIPAVMAGAAAAAVIGGLAGAIPVPLAADAGTWLAGGAAWLPLRGLIASGTAAAALPLAAIPLAGAPWFTAAWYPGLALVVRRLNRRAENGPPALEPIEAAAGLPRHVLPEVAAFAPTLAWAARPRRVAIGVVLAVVLATAMSGSDGRLHLTVLDIGQGDAILIESPDGTIALVDGGVDPDLTLRRIGESMAFHERRIDVIVLTHPHQDHLGGLVEVLRRYEVGAYLDCGCGTTTEPHRELVAAARAESGARVLAARVGQRIPLGGGAELEILHPSETDVAGFNPDDNIHTMMVVALLRYGQFSALLTGDMEESVEALLAERELLTRIDVLKVGHHGSETSSSIPFLEAIRPSLAVISLGADNEYGHPHRSVLDNLSAVPGLLVLRTDQEGSIEVVTDGASLWVVTERRRLGPLPAR